MPRNHEETSGSVLLTGPVGWNIFTLLETGEKEKNKHLRHLHSSPQQPPVPATVPATSLSGL